MFQRIANWFDERTGYRRLAAIRRSRVIPGGPCWRYVTGRCLLAMLGVEVITGLLLMATYSPSSTTAWASVHYIEHMAGGSFLRGLHYYGGQALIVLLVIHTVRVLLEGTFRAPRELIWATGLLLFPLTVFWAITGNPLPWTQRGYGQIQVEASIIASTPLIGPVMQRLLIGGEELGHLTLTHLYFLHVGLFPLLAFLLLGVHVLQVFQHGTAASRNTASPEPHLPYWPYQTVRNMAALAVTLVVVSVLAIYRGKIAPLDAPADPTLPSTPRPEWYFLGLFELRGYFSGDWEIVATVVIPLVVLIVLLAMPAIDRRLPRTVGAVFRVVVVAGGLAGWGSLTYLAWARDWNDPEYQAAQQTARQLAARALELATPGGIPPDGAIALLRNDPQTRGPMLFEDHCASCHRFGRRFQTGQEAADLTGFASAGWIRDLLRDPADPRFFGHTKHKRMKKWQQENLADPGPEQQAELDTIARWLAGHPRGIPKETDESDFAKGYDAFSNLCLDCHKYEGEGGTDFPAPDFTAYGSPEWTRRLLRAPNAEDFYGKRSAMPSFAEEMTEHEMDMLLEWFAREKE